MDSDEAEDSDMSHRDGLVVSMDPFPNESE
jgi:hypothetical protein